MRIKTPENHQIVKCATSYQFYFQNTLSHRTRVDHLPADYEERSLLLAAIRGLRTEPTSFGDDGPISAYKLLRRLEEHSDLVTDGERAVLDRAADWIDQPSAELLTGLQILQDKLLDRLSDT